MTFEIPESVELSPSDKLLLELPGLGLTNEQIEKICEILEVSTIWDGDKLVGFAWPSDDGDCVDSISFGE